MREKHKLEFDILRDQGNGIAAQFGLRHTLPGYLRQVYLQFPLDLPRVNGEDSWTLPMPARYVIAQNDVIASAEYDPDYTRRPEVTEMLEALKELKSAK